MHFRFHHFLKHFSRHLSSFLFVVIQTFVSLRCFWGIFCIFCLFGIDGGNKGVVLFDLAQLFLHCLLFYNFFDIEERLGELLRDWLPVNIWLKSKPAFRCIYLAENVFDWSCTPCIWSLACASRGLAVGTGWMMAACLNFYPVWVFPSAPWLTCWDAWWKRHARRIFPYQSLYSYSNRGNHHARRNKWIIMW